jgi:hypothetical protein
MHTVLRLRPASTSPEMAGPLPFRGAPHMKIVEWLENQADSTIPISKA